MENELYHRGIPGMRWGVRRFQNEDGTLTPAGKERYAKQAYREARRDYRKLYEKSYMWGSNSKSVKRQETKIRERRKNDPTYKKYSTQGRTKAVAYIQSVFSFPAKAVLYSSVSSIVLLNSTKKGRAVTKSLLQTSINKLNDSDIMMKGAKFMQDIIRKASDMRGDYTVVTELPKMLSR
nr:MAG TPA: hypothetical protein [Caudoviricetes sp.]